MKSCFRQLQCCHLLANALITLAMQRKQLLHYNAMMRWYMYQSGTVAWISVPALYWGAEEYLCDATNILTNIRPMWSGDVR